MSIDLLSLPLGALKKAQRTLVQATAISDSDSDQSEWSDEEHTSSKAKEKAKPEWSTRPRPDLAKRANKHAYVAFYTWPPIIHAT